MAINNTMREDMVTKLSRSIPAFLKVSPQSGHIDFAIVERYLNGKFQTEEAVRYIAGLIRSLSFSTALDLRMSQGPWETFPQKKEIKNLPRRYAKLEYLSRATPDEIAAALEMAGPRIERVYYNNVGRSK